MISELFQAVSTVEGAGTCLAIVGALVAFIGGKFSPNDDGYKYKALPSMIGSAMIIGGVWMMFGAPRP